MFENIDFGFRRVYARKSTLSTEARQTLSSYGFKKTDFKWVKSDDKNAADFSLMRSSVDVLKNNPEIKKDIAYTAIVNDIGDIDIIDECVEEYILNEPTLTEFINVQHIAGDDEESRKDALKKVRVGLSKLAASTPRYQCKECGFSTQRLLWQCPSCKDWETQRPFASVQFDSLLQRSGINH